MTEYSVRPTAEAGVRKETTWVVYEVEERRDEWDHIYLRARYIGPEDSGPSATDKL